METAVSIPDQLFNDADVLSRRIGLSRSALYTKAIAAFVKAHRSHNVTEELDRIYATQKAALDPVAAQMRRSSGAGRSLTG